MKLNKKKFFCASTCLLILTLSELCPAMEIVNIWNQPGNIVGTTNFLDATFLALQLAFSNVNLFSSREINILDTVDVSTNAFNSSIGDFSLKAPMINLDFDVKMGSGRFVVAGDTLNLTGTVLNSDNTVRSQTGFSARPDGPTTVNVKGDTASIQQGIDMSNSTSPVTVNVTAGSYAEDLSVPKSITANLDVGGPTTVQSLSIGGTTAGTLTLANGTLNATNGTSIASNGELSGNGQFLGDITNNGAVFTATGASRTVSGVYSGSGALTGTGKVVFEGRLSPGSNPAAGVGVAVLAAAGDVALAATNVTDMELGGTLRGSEYDAVDVAGTLILGGVLNVSFIDLITSGYKAQAGDLFTLFSASLIQGDFSTVVFPSLDPGLVWAISHTSTSYSLSVSAVPTPSAIWLVLSGIVSIAVSAKRQSSV